MPECGEFINVLRCLWGVRGEVDRRVMWSGILFLFLGPGQLHGGCYKHPSRTTCRAQCRCRAHEKYEEGCWCFCFDRLSAAHTFHTCGRYGEDARGEEHPQFSQGGMLLSFSVLLFLRIHFLHF